MTAETNLAELTLPYHEARLSLELTARAAGCPDPIAGFIAQSAWHLTNRGLGGVGYVIRYISLLLQNDSIDSSALALLGQETALMIGGSARKGRALRIPHAPLLVLPFASEILRDEAETDAILFTFDDCTIVYSKTHGIRILAGSQADIEHVALNYYPTCTASRIAYDDPGDMGLDLGFTRNERLTLPRVLYRGPDQPLDVDMIRSL